MVAGGGRQFALAQWRRYCHAGVFYWRRCGPLVAPVKAAKPLSTSGLAASSANSANSANSVSSVDLGWLDQARREV